MANAAVIGSSPGAVATAAGALEIEIMRSLRRIIRAVDLHSRRLLANHGLTSPQLLCLLAVRESAPVRVSALARDLHLSPSTVIGILDRLVAKRLVRRRRAQEDRRAVLVSLTDAGAQVAERAPSPLQDRFANAFGALSSEEKLSMVSGLQRVVELMEAGDLDAAPILETGPLPTPAAEPPAVTPGEKGVL